ncbi:SOUL family heme-binding protein [Blastochloris viridis]|uniref:SOUL heme-binding protein n=1 Tax=Blastochloris viridis TaxID=1079 RepID=A0A0H5BG95_BLAVI|nr:heme-binding protein [Blastochloris viridis]ALK09941.1 SOUL heme-binding protein [Blastochloris viridis]BAS00150.1 hypothetical protein BV133_2556 [Blastochloris viridis]CUU42604.1 SOUL heme-binding protein [Blastochloris viridis]
MLNNLTYYAALVLETAVGAFGVRLYEEPPYMVVDRIGDVEIRKYPPRLAAEVEYPQHAGARGNDAFMLLFNYIAGANGGTPDDNKIAMTVPVEMREPQRIAMTTPVETVQDGGVGRLRFFLPATVRRETAPKPDNDRVKIVTVPEETVAVLRFSGLGMGKELAARQAELAGQLARSKWQQAGVPFALYYDGPFTLPFLRRNEAAVAVTLKQ